MREPADTLAEALSALGTAPVLVVTGAGISQASGIPTFRGNEPGAVWRRYDLEMATVEFFHRDPAAQWRWYLERFAAIDEARPNPAHLALARIERWHTDRGGDFLLVTQNIDPLHELAGSERLVKIHGTADRVRCARPGCRFGAPAGSLPRADLRLDRFLAEPVAENLPRCPACDGLLRAHVLFFDEYYQEHQDYQFERALAAGERAALLLFAGTSFSVGITDLLLRASRSRQVPTFAIDPDTAPAAQLGLTALQDPAERLLPEVCERLGAAA